MISKKDVVTLRMPFPNIQASLAVQSHMYICLENINNQKKFIKCQTAKAKLINKVNTYIIEESDSTRNPFLKETLLDLDKKFFLLGVKIPLLLRTSIRTNISDILYNEILKKINVSIGKVNIDTNEFLSVNTKCYKILN